LQNSLIITGTLPASIVNILRTNLQQSKKKMLTQLTGMSKRQAEDILEQILKRAIPVSPGRINKFEIRGPKEARVLQFASSYVKGGPLFGENDLFEDFCRALIASGTLLPGEKSLLKSSKAAISIFSLAVMQNSRIELADGEFATFFVVPDIRGNIGGYVVGEMGKRPNGIDTAYLWTMETSLSFKEYCEPAIIPIGRTKVLGDLQLSFSDSGKPLLALKL
jgi:hypothetical protein